MMPDRRLFGAALAIAAFFIAPPTLVGQRLSVGFSGRHASVHADVNLGSERAHGHWVLQRERVWVPGCRRIVHVPARYGVRYDSCGRAVRYLIEPACERVVEEPGRYEWRTKRVWVSHGDRHHRSHRHGHRHGDDGRRYRRR